MKLVKSKDYISNQIGMTLVEILVSFAILSIIIIPFFTILTKSAFVINKSANTIDATYVAQRVIEEMYNQSKDVTVPAPADGEERDWDLYNGDYWIYKKISTQTNRVKVLVKVYSDTSESNLEAQMETLLIWHD
ncbi:type IV pilus modification PilV family protein [Serpentinicella alkaliphila]|uniref:Pilin/secretion family protein with methylation motif n=1 Tax=Serpentinicella alkaliphila TaxID=1734049 RepID=A0A4R2TEP4_9FIRM|nr:type II secretion system protein [Serpentinicella alkaliphila]QUH26661.1 type II secretion system protein [Serpentinicella alkaliphila]TCQ00542.1 pilin/secretion family protein with methylation motif [Serpentinicella alkaliphila]